MIRIIVNADDCGLSAEVDKRIEDAIKQGVISSTTIMANMNDFDGSIRLYNNYSDVVSFGVHLNLTEGQPMTKSQILIDKGIFHENNGKLSFNASPYRRQLLSSEIREAIYQELQTQVEKILDNKVTISHIDSHHFIHQAVFMLPILPRLCKKYCITKIRNYSNYIPFSLNRALRNSWYPIIRMQNRNVDTTDWFTSFTHFCECQKRGNEYGKKNQTIELMTHPGGIYEEEDELLFNTNWSELSKYKLINYNDL